MGFDFGDREDSAFLDDFDAEVVKAGFIEGTIAAEYTRTGRATASKQLLLAWKPLGDDDVNIKYGFYSMGQKGFAFTGDSQKIVVGTKEYAIFPEVTDGKIRKNSRLGVLLERLSELEFNPAGNKADVFMGLQCHINREKYPSTTLNVEREALMPTAILKMPEATASAPNADMDDAVIAIVDGHTDADLPQQVWPRLKALGIKNLAGVYQTVDSLVVGGKLLKSGETYKKV